MPMTGFVMTAFESEFLRELGGGINMNRKMEANIRGCEGVREGVLEKFVRLARELCRGDNMEKSIEASRRI